jgi:hypothetical protein
MSGAFQKVMLPMLGHVDPRYRSARFIHNFQTPGRYDDRFERKEKED